MNLVTITDNIALVAASIAGVRGATGQEQDAVPPTPYVVVGLPKALQIIPGDRTVVNMAIPMYLLIERVSDMKRDIRTVYGYVPTFVTTFAKDGSLGATVQHCAVTAWDTNTTYELGGALYWAVDFTLSITVHEQVTQALRTVI